MRVLVIGSGGREHTICWKLQQSHRQVELFCAPGNAGIAQVAKCVPIAVDDLVALRNFALKECIDLTVVGPEAPLAAGIVDLFQASGLTVFGPTKAAAAIESSKAFAKNLMYKYQIPTAKYQVFTDHVQALAYVHEQGAPIVIKANGLAAGKGVVVATNIAEAVEALENIFAQPNQTVVIEECLVGEELSLMAFVDHETVVPMVLAQDHKRVFDQDQGPNTGGMGAYSPCPQFDATIVETAMELVLVPATKAMIAEGCPFTGILYAGLMVTDSGIKVIEFNARFGDPETQVVLPRLETDLLDVFLACVDHKLVDLDIKWRDYAAVTIVLASPGYPGNYPTGTAITGLDSLGAAASADEVHVFHSGTANNADQTGFVTAGGRVLAITGLGADFLQARQRAYQAIAQINFPGMHYRTDIGAKAL